MPGKIQTASTEALLIDRTLQGGNDAFADLVAPHLSSLNRFARVRLRREPEAEDVVQQAVLRAFCHLKQFRGEATFKTWLYAIAFNEVNQLRRGRAMTHLRPLSEARAASVPDPANSPEMQCQHSEEAQRLHQALAKLPDKYRHVIQLRDLRELSIAETARSLSLTVAAVKVRHHRAHKLLHKKLADVRPGGRRLPSSKGDSCRRP
jgi:RNA polymerase sigma-70 factor (ECF subfamily)